MSPEQDGSLLAIVTAYWAAEHVKDMDGVLAHYHRDACITTPSTSAWGLDEIRGFYQAVFDGYREVSGEILRSLASGEEIAAEYTCRLVQHDGTVKNARGCNVFTIRGGKIASLRCYFDPADF